MTRPFRVTHEKLRAAGACNGESMRRFLAEWPDGAEVTEANVQRALELELPLLCAAECLPDQARRTFLAREEPAWAVYIIARDWQVYEKAVATVLLEAAAGLTEPEEKEDGNG